MPREVITLQLGNYANYVGAHYWNIQDELLGLAESSEWRDTAAYTDPDVLFRTGETSQGVATYTPRLVLMDLMGALGGVSCAGVEHQELGVAPAVGATLWGGPTEVHSAQRIPRSAYVRQLEDEEVTPMQEGVAAAGLAAEPSPVEVAAQSLQEPGVVRFWTDYLKVQLHPRSVWEVPGVWHGGDRFGGFGDGAAVLAGGAAREECLDRIRFFAEECDSMQGFQVMVDQQSGFGRVAADLLLALRDDYGATPSLLFGLQAAPAPPRNGQDGAAAAIRKYQLNEAFAYGTLAPLASLYCPAAPPTPGAAPHLQFDVHDRFQSSALLAAALDTVTMPYRLRKGFTPASLGAATGGIDMWSLAQLLNPAGHANLVGLTIALPAPPLPSDPHARAAASDTRTGESEAAAGFRRRIERRGEDMHSTAVIEGSGAMPWTPGLAATPSGTIAELAVLRGARQAQCALNPGQIAAAAAAGAALDTWRLQDGARCVRRSCVVPQPLPLPLPFPQIFSAALSKHGDIPKPHGEEPGDSESPRPASGRDGDVVSLPVLGHLLATRDFREVLKQQRQLLEGASGTATGRAILGGWGFSTDDVSEVRDALYDMAQSYEEDDGI